MSPAPHVVIVGAGSTGCALAHDLALRGLRVTIVEQGSVASGTTGHNQAQLHSGARYAAVDPEAARECIQENRILRRIMPGCLELNDGLFVATRPEHLDYLPAFLKACQGCGIPAEEIYPAEALRLEPRLNPRLLAAVRIPDGVFEPYRFCLSFLATALKNGAELSTYTRVEAIDTARGEVQVVSVRSGERSRIHADLVVNAAGPWADRVARLAGGSVAVEASAGVMVAVADRLCNRVINLLAPPGDGDIIVPQRQTSLLGTTSWRVDDPDAIPIPPDHIELIYRVAEELIPGVRRCPLKGVNASARPLVLEDGAGGRQTSRKFAVIDHAGQGLDGLFSIVGGKTTTARLMAERAADRICARLGVQVECRTAETPLLSYREAVL